MHDVCLSSFAHFVEAMCQRLRQILVKNLLESFTNMSQEMSAERFSVKLHDFVKSQCATQRC